MVQFYIASGTIIASIILQCLLYRNITRTDNKISEKQEDRLKTIKSSVMALSYIKVLSVVMAIMFVLSIGLVVFYKELFVGIVFLAMQLMLMVIMALLNQKVGKIAAISETQETHIFKMDYNYTEEMKEQLHTTHVLKVIGVFLVFYANTVGLYVTYTVLNDTILFGLLNLAVMLVGYRIILHSMRKRQEIVFSNQLGALSKEELDKYMVEALEEFTVGVKDFVKEKDTVEEVDIPETKDYTYNEE